MTRTLFLSLALAGCTSPDPDSGRKPKPGDDSATSVVDDTGRDDTATGGDDTGATFDPVSIGFDGLAELGAHNLVVVQVDTLRANHLTRYGYDRETFPQTGGLNWLFVDRLYAASSWTLPSSVSLLTGLMPYRHGVLRVGSDHTSPELTATTAASVFSAAGYATAFMSGNQALQQVESAFREFDSRNEDLAATPSADLAWEVANLSEWIDTLPPETPFYAHLQPMDVHGPYDPAEDMLGVFSDPDAIPFDLSGTEDEQLEAFRAAYDAATTDEERAALVYQLNAVYDEGILSVDEGFARLFNMLRGKGMLRDTIVVFVADHGETLGEENNSADQFYFGHGGKVREELVRVPMLIYNPALPADDQVGCLASNVDVMPTMLRALGLPAMEGVDGQALQDGCRTLSRTDVFAGNSDTVDLTEIGVTDARQSLRWDCRGGRIYRYDLTTDATAVSTVASLDGEVELTAEMESQLADIQAIYPDVTCAVK